MLRKKVTTLEISFNEGKVKRKTKKYAVITQALLNRIDFIKSEDL